MIPFFCKSKDIERTTSGAVGVGATEIPTVDAPSYFTAGDRLFISDPDGAGVEYLGTVVSVGSAMLTVEFATATARAAGDIIWTAQSRLDWPPGKRASIVSTKRSGVEVVRSLGGLGYATRLHDAYRVETVRFENLTDDRFATLSLWFDQQTNGGLDEFTYVDSDRVVRRVRFDAPQLEWRRTAEDLIALAFNLQLLAESSYI